VQGRRNIPLSEDGKTQVSQWQLPTEMQNWTWISSPLQRCIETTVILSERPPKLDPRFIEMDWGDWEGETIAEMSHNHPETFGQWEGGDQFVPVPNGESPGQVRDRVQDALRTFADEGPWVLVAHKGIIRSLVSLATGWDMTGKPPIKFRDACWHHFALDMDGTLKIVAMNNPLLPETSP